MDHQFIFPKVSMIIPIARSTSYPLSMIYWVVHDGSWCHAYMWFDHAHRHATRLVSVGTDAWIEVVDPTKQMVQCPLEDQLRYPAPMLERATLSIYTLIDFFPRVDMTAWRCRLCPTPPDPPGTTIAESPRWTGVLDEGWAQREARMHLAELHDIRFDQQK